MADVKLPPLPPRVPVDKHLPTGVVIYGYTNDMMCDYARDYARANVAAKDAEIEALLAEVRRLQALPQWNPIETAPMDGTQSRMLLAWPDGTVEQGMFLKNETWQGFRPESLRPWPAGQPVKWMPLPEPPVGEK